MRALILHANKFKTRVTSKSNLPEGIISDESSRLSEKMENCVVVFFCVEKGDTIKQIDALYQEVCKTSDDFKTRNLMIAPFVHLSNNLPDDPMISKKLYEELVNKFDKKIFTVKTSQFGKHKSLLLDVKGYPGSFRYREFY